MWPHSFSRKGSESEIHSPVETHIRRAVHWCSHRSWQILKTRWKQGLCYQATSWAVQCLCPVPNMTFSISMASALRTRKLFPKKLKNTKKTRYLQPSRVQWLSLLSGECRLYCGRYPFPLPYSKELVMMVLTGHDDFSVLTGPSRLDTMSDKLNNVCYTVCLW